MKVSHALSGFYWLMLFLCFSALGAECPSEKMIEAGLLKINEIRARPRHCGEFEFSKADPLKWNDSLYRAALQHAHDLRAQAYFEHDSKDGRSPGDRMAQQGYVWQSYGENMAAGQDSLDELFLSWLQSVPHCKTLMQPDFKEFGLVCSEKAGRLYWVLDMAEP